MMDESLSPMAILDKARKAVPAVNYALGVAGVAAAAAIVSWLVGSRDAGAATEFLHDVAGRLSLE